MTERHPYDEHLGDRVRVWDGQGASIRAEGKLIAIIPTPVLVIEDDNGVRHYEPSTLRIEAAETHWTAAKR